jgi:SAM-dependent methyltransferase
VDDYDRRLLALYDEDNPDGPDHDFYRALADEVSAHSILDLGCGTGILTVTFAGQERTVVGVDPSASMLAYAQGRAGAAAVDWLLGDSRSIPAGSFDYAVMTGNVAQHIGHADWTRTLEDLHTALRAGGTLSFESRNPAVHAWKGWASNKRTTRETGHGTLVEWCEVEESAPGIVKLVAHNFFAETSETVTEAQVLVFRDRSALEGQLNAAGFDVKAVYGDWRRSPFTEEAPLMVFVACAR